MGPVSLSERGLYSAVHTSILWYVFLVPPVYCGTLSLLVISCASLAPPVLVFDRSSWQCSRAVRLPLLAVMSCVDTDADGYLSYVCGCSDGVSSFECMGVYVGSIVQSPNGVVDEGCLFLLCLSFRFMWHPLARGARARVGVCPVEVCTSTRANTSRRL